MHFIQYALFDTLYAHTVGAGKIAAAHKLKAARVGKQQFLPLFQIRSYETRENYLKNIGRMRNQHEIAHSDRIGYEIDLKTRH